MALRRPLPGTTPGPEARPGPPLAVAGPGPDAPVGADTAGAAPDVVVATGVRVKHYTSRARRPDGLSLTVRAGEVLVVTGPSGCGKSSLALTLDGLVPHHVEADLDGTVVVLGRDVASPAGRDLVRDVAMVFQDPDAQLVTTNVLDEVCFGLGNLEVPAERLESRAREALDLVGLAALADEAPMRLSGGQRQRLALAAALAMRPALLVLDEPTSHLDARAAAAFLALVPRLRDEGRTVVIVDHDLDRVLEHADRLLVLDRTGAALASGPPAELLADRAAEIAAAGVRLPVAVRARQQLERLGVRGTGTPLTIAQARTAFAAADTSGCAAPAAPPDPAGGAAVVLRAERLRVRRGRRTVVPDLSVTVREGEWVALVGRNGAGKTTAALALAGLVRSEGRLGVGGTDPRRLSMRELSDTVGYVFQNPEHQFVADTVAAEIGYGLRRRRLPARTVAARVDELLDRLDLHAVRRQHPFQLSGGEKRRLSVATVLATGPRLLLLDEPSYGLDEAATASLLAVLHDLRDAGTTIVTVVHDLSLAADHATRVLVLDGGRLVADGAAATVLADDALLTRSGLAPLPLRECLSGLRERDPRFASVVGLDQLAAVPA